MSIKKIVLSIFFYLIAVSPVVAATEYVSVTKTVTPSTLENVCSEATVEIKVKGANEQAEIRKKLDIVLVMDHSYSMFEYNDGRMGESQDAATTFIDELDPNFDNVGLVRFSTTAELQENLTNTYTPVKNTINGYYHDAFSSFTNLEDAINTGINEIDSNGRADATKLIILFSDGGVNRPLNGGSEDKPYAKSQALNKAVEAGSKNIIIYTVTLGTSNIDIDLMNDIADVTSGKSFIAPNPQDIVDAYLQIASEITNSVASNIKITDIVNNKFILVGGSDSPTANIVANPDGSKTLTWNLGVLKSNQEAKFRYKIVPTEEGNNQPIDLNPFSKVEYLDVNGDATNLVISETKVSVESDDCGRGGGDDDEEDNDHDEDDEDSDDEESDGRGGLVLGASTSRIGQLPVTGGFADALFKNTCGDRFEIQLILLAQSAFHFLALLMKKRKLQIVVAVVFPIAIYLASGCISPVLIASLAVGAGFIILARALPVAYIFKSK